MIKKNLKQQSRPDRCVLVMLGAHVFGIMTRTINPSTVFSSAPFKHDGGVVFVGDTLRIERACSPIVTKSLAHAQSFITISQIAIAVCVYHRLLLVLNCVPILMQDDVSVLCVVHNEL